MITVKMISNQFQGPSPVPRGPSMVKDFEKKFQTRLTTLKSSSDYH